MEDVCACHLYNGLLVIRHQWIRLPSESPDKRWVLESDTDVIEDVCPRNENINSIKFIIKNSD